MCVVFKIFDVSYAKWKGMHLRNVVGLAADHSVNVMSLVGPFCLYSMYLLLLNDCSLSLFSSLSLSEQVLVHHPFVAHFSQFQNYISSITFGTHNGKEWRVKSVLMLIYGAFSATLFILVMFALFSVLQCLIWGPGLWLSVATVIFHINHYCHYC